MRIKTLISLALVVLLSSLLVLQPLSAGAAADCVAERAAFDALIKEVEALKSNLPSDLARVNQALDDLQVAARQIDALHHDLAGAPDRVSQELKDKGLSASLTALGIQVALTIALFAAGPEGWGFAAESAITALEAAEHMHTALEVDQLLREAMEATAVVDELSSGLGRDRAELRKFADENDLSELKSMLSMEDLLAAEVKNYDRAWNRLKDASQKAKSEQARLEQAKKELQDAQEKLYACLGIAGPIPNACEGQATNPNGAGVCR